MYIILTTNIKKDFVNSNKNITFAPDLKHNKFINN